MTPAARREGLLLGLSALAFFGGFYLRFVPVRGAAPGPALLAFGLASIGARPLAGRLADGVGARALLAFGGLVLATAAAAGGIAAASVLAAAGAGLDQVPTGALLGLAYAAFSTALAARVAGVAPPAWRARALAWSGIPANAAMGLAPALTALTGPCATEAALASAAGLLGLASSLAAASLAPPPQLATPRGTDPPPPRAAAPPVPVTLRAGPPRPGGLVLLSGLLFTAFTQLAPAALGPAAAAAFAAYAAGMVATRLGGLTAARRLGLGLASSFALAGAGLVALAGAVGAAAAVTAALLLAMGLGLQHPALLERLVAAEPPGRSGRGAARFHLGFDLGIGLGGAALGLAAGHLGSRGSLLAAALTAAGGALVAAPRRPALSRRPTSGAPPPPSGAAGTSAAWPGRPGRSPW